jgi:hypothetical protein
LLSSSIFFAQSVRAAPGGAIGGVVVANLSSITCGAVGVVDADVVGVAVGAGAGAQTVDESKITIPNRNHIKFLFFPI